jgi:hypothetical protein
VGEERHRLAGVRQHGSARRPRCRGGEDDRQDWDALREGDGQGDVAFVGTRGNDVVVKSVKELDASILGPIDTPHEAAVLATTRERAPLTCEDGQLVGVKRNSGNFEVAVITFDKCTGKKTRVISAVETNGSMRELQTDSLTEGEPKVCER